MTESQSGTVAKQRTSLNILEKVLIVLTMGTNSQNFLEPRYARLVEENITCSGFRIVDRMSNDDTQAISPYYVFVPEHA